MTNNSHFFDYIITGFGCAGMSLVYYLIESKLKGKNILIIENAQKTRNDRTWCYWAEKPLDIHPKKSPLVFWEQIEISNGSHSVKKPLDKLKYYHIQSSDFYHEILEKIKAYPNIKFLQDSVISFEEFGNNKVNVKTQNNGIYTSLKVFDSIPKYKIDATNSKMLQQIFVGWKIKTPNKQFDKHTAVMMDFDNYNKNQTAFFYVLPFSEDEALLEYTVFSTEKIEKEMMESHLKRYIDENLKERDYEITFREEGSIPMTTFEFTKIQDGNIVSLGTLAGCSKASTGYTFYNIQKHCQEIVNALENQKGIKNLNWKRKSRFKFYDNILLNIAKKWPQALPDTFFNLFQTNPGAAVLKFLNEESNFFEELRLLFNLKFSIFIKSLIHYEKH